MTAICRERRGDDGAFEEHFQGAGDGVCEDCF